MSLPHCQSSTAARAWGAVPTAGRGVLPANALFSGSPRMHVRPEKLRWSIREARPAPAFDRRPRTSSASRPMRGPTTERERSRARHPFSRSASSVTFSEALLRRTTARADHRAQRERARRSNDARRARARDLDRPARHVALASSFGDTRRLVSSVTTASPRRIDARASPRTRRVSAAARSAAGVRRTPA